MSINYPRKKHARPEWPLQHGGMQGPDAARSADQTPRHPTHPSLDDRVRAAYSKGHASKLTTFTRWLRSLTPDQCAARIFDGTGGPRTKLNRLSALNTACKLLGLVSPNSSVFVLRKRHLQRQALTTPLRQARPASPMAVRRIVRGASTALRHTIVSTYLAGLRVRDIFRVKPRDVRVEKCGIRLRIRGAKLMGPGSMSYWRWIPCRALGAEGTRWWSNGNTPALRTTMGQVTRRLKKFGYTLHSLRRGVATAAAHRGATMEQIQKMLGHESIASTRRYVEPSSYQRDARMIIHIANKLWH